MKKNNAMFGPKGRIWWPLGILCVAGMLLPYLILGEDSIVVYHDQLDGEFIAYILQAKHLFESGGLPEFMGMGKSALLPPAPMCVLLFCQKHYFAAYVAMQLLGSLAGFGGMYLLGRDLTDRNWIGFLAGVLYAYLPFKPVYGLAQYGLPLLLWCAVRLGKGPGRKEKFFCVLYCALYALNSSLALIGFAVLGLWGAGMVCCKKARKRSVFFTWVMMILLYAVENAGLLLQIFGGVGEVSHKAEYVLQREPFLSGVWTGFIKGMQHGEDYHACIFVLALAAMLYRAWEWIAARRGRDGGREEEENFRKPQTWLMPVLLGVNLLLAVLAAFWNAGAGIALREKLQTLKGFQLGRVLWLSSVFWYVILVCVLSAGADAARRLLRRKNGRIRGAGWAGGIASAAIFLGLCLLSLQVLKGSNLKPNLQKLLHPEYPAISYSDYYALGVMDQVREYLDATSGLDVSQYRVASLGIDPAAAYYAGFYCLDGYSNNYSLEYKHRFRQAIAPELEKSEYLAENFDGWGNRCYLFSAECPGYYTIEKNGFYFQNYSVNTQALRELGGRYLLSAAYIMNGEATGLRLLTETPFETEDSYYRIFVYEIEGE